MSNQKQVYDPPYCQCRVMRNGIEVEIVSDGCPVHNPHVEPDALVRALPLKSEVDNATAWEDAADSLLRPRQVFTHYPLVTAEVKELYGGRYGR